MTHEEFRELDNLLNKFWTDAVGREGYNKPGWVKLQSGLWRLWVELDKARKAPPLSQWREIEVGCSSPSCTLTTFHPSGVCSVCRERGFR